MRGAEIVAREAEEAFRDEHEGTCAWAGRSEAVPLDLHRLVPVPWKVLRLGPDAPASLRRLWRHRGTTWPLRRVERLPCPDGAWRVGFFSADWTPWPVLAMCRARWPALGFRLRIAHAAD